MLWPPCNVAPLPSSRRAWIEVQLAGGARCEHDSRTGLLSRTAAVGLTHPQETLTWTGHTGRRRRIKRRPVRPPAGSPLRVGRIETRRRKRSPT